MLRRFKHACAAAYRTVGLCLLRRLALARVFHKYSNVLANTHARTHALQLEMCSSIALKCYIFNCTHLQSPLSCSAFEASIKTRAKGRGEIALRVNVCVFVGVSVIPRRTIALFFEQRQISPFTRPILVKP